MNGCPIFHVADENANCIINCPNTAALNKLDDTCDCKYCYSGTLCDQKDPNINEYFCGLVNDSEVSNIELSKFIN